MSQHLVSGANDFRLPEAGLRVAGPGQFGVILQSRDKVGRQFPILLLCTRDGASISRQNADIWIENALPLALGTVRGERNADQLQTALGDVEPPQWDETATDRFELWSEFVDPLPVIANRPAEALRQICA